MRHFKTFDDVKRQAPDRNLAAALVRSCQERLETAIADLQTHQPKFVLENAYESIRECIDAVLSIDGYKSYSHEASVAYLSELGFSVSDVAEVDRLRKMRNGIKYYGESVAKTDAEHALVVARKMIQAILRKRRFD